MQHVLHAGLGILRSAGVNAAFADWVEDRSGRTRELLAMPHDLDGLTNTVAEPVRV